MIPAYHRTHPFDRQYGTETSGVVPVEMIASDRMMMSQINPYCGSQPSIIRRAIAALGKTDEFHFVDLGCGKGRAMIVASEFPFRSITGVELSPRLAKTARRNVARIARRFPARTPVVITEGNAVTFPFPKGKVLLFFYHSFGVDLLKQLLSEIESFVLSANGLVYFIYYNPVHGSLLDASPTFSRWYAETFPYDESEMGFGSDAEDSVVIWQSVNGAASTPHAHADRPIAIKTALWKAELAGGSQGFQVQQLRSG
jgi:SAM-dependent methyltransferase